MHSFFFEWCLSHSFDSLQISEEYNSTMENAKIQHHPRGQYCTCIGAHVTIYALLYISSLSFTLLSFSCLFD